MKRINFISNIFNVIIIICVLIININSVSFGFNLDKHETKSHSNNQHSNNICVTPECINIGSRILRDLNNNIDPCDNFYQFSCGKFIKNSIIPQDKNIVANYDVSQDNIRLGLINILRQSVEKNESKPMKLSKQLFNNCMDTEKLNRQGLNPLFDIVEEIGGWPLLKGTNWDELNFDWKKLMYKLNNIGYTIDSFLTFTVFVDFTTYNWTLFLKQATFPLDLTKGRDDVAVKQYYKLMIDIARMMGADNNMDINNQLDDVLNFEIKLASISSLNNESSINERINNNHTTLAHLMINYPTIPWNEYLNNIFQSDNNLIVDNSIIIDENPYFTLNFVKLMNETPMRVLGNYLIWKVILNSIEYLNDELRIRHSTYLPNEEENIISRDDECLIVVYYHLKMSLYALYGKKYINTLTINEINAVFTNVKDQLENLLDKAKWLENNDKKYMTEKIDTMTSKIYSDYLLNDTILENYYRDLNLDDNNYLRSILNLKKFYRDNIYHKTLGKSFIDTFIDEPSMMNSSDIINLQERNLIVLPITTLKYPFYHNNYPKYINYGLLGSQIGREMFKGFDSSGNQYDKYGVKNSLWSNNTMINYEKKIQCFIDQYNKYKTNGYGSKVNDVASLNEYIDDNVGFKIAYLAYSDWLNNNENIDVKLPELLYTPKQMFWISIANNYCSVNRKDNDSNMIIIDDKYSPDELRIVGSLSNYPEFSADFNCQKKSKMNPIDKCDIIQ